MKTQISGEQLYEAFFRAGLGTEDSYYVWTPLWALRSKIWREKSLRKLARKTLGKLAMEAIGEGDSDLLRQLADALDRMLEFERVPENAVRADVFFAVEELNESYPSFTRADLLWWLNEEMEAVVTKDEVEEALELMGLAEAIPKGKRKLK